MYNYTKTVTIDATTSGGFPETMMINTLAVLSTWPGTTNTLQLQNANTSDPLQIYNGFTLDGAGAVLVNNSSIQASKIITIGAFGAGNCLIITNGGQVISTNAAVYIGENASSSNNFALVTGAGSVWTNTGSLWIGQHGSGNTLTIASGGAVCNASGFISDEVSGNNNTVIVTGSHSLWNNSDSLYVGRYGSSNTLTIANGGIVSSCGAVIGWNSSAVGNTATVTGPNSVWNSTDSLYVGYLGSGNRLIVTNGGSVVNANDGYIGYGTGADNSAVLVTGAGSGWTCSQKLFLGSSSVSNCLVIADGGRVDTGFGVIGSSNSASRANYVIVTGANSTWNVGTLTIGAKGSENSLIISNSATVQVTKRLDTGLDSFMWGNRIQLMNGGVLIVQNPFNVASAVGAEASVQVAGGTIVLSSDLIVGGYLNSTGTVQVTGAGSLIATNGVIGVGNAGTVSIGSGVGSIFVSTGTVLASSILLGSSSGGQGNMLLRSGGLLQLFGTNSELSCNNVLQDGGDLVITNGTLYMGRTYPGEMIMSNGVANCQAVYVGYDNNGTLSIMGGTLKASSVLQVGSLAGSTGTVFIGGGQLLATNANTVVGSLGMALMTMSGGTMYAKAMVLGVGGSGPSCTLKLNGGTLTADSLTMISTRGQMQFLRGWLSSRTITNANGAMFVVGDGLGAATLALQGQPYVFTDGLRVAANAVLTGSGTINGFTVNEGSISNDTSGGSLTFTGTVTNQANGIITVLNGSRIAFQQPVVNKGVIRNIGGQLQFLGGVTGTGQVIESGTATNSWAADRLRVGPDGKLQLLWRHLSSGVPDGQVSLWTLDTNAVYLSSLLLGPISGWTVADLVISDNDSTPHVVWTNTTGEVSVWNFNTSGFVAQSLGPYSGWSLGDFKISKTDGKQHLLWRHTSGQASLWTFFSDGNYQSATTVGPYSGWAPVCQQISPVDNRLHLFWTNTTAAISLWRFNASGAFEGAQGFGPFSGWTANQILPGSVSNDVYLAWTNTTGAVGFWQLTNNYAIASGTGFGPISGWASLGLLMRPDNLMHLVWENASAASCFWQINATGTVQSGFQVGPYSGWLVQDACVDANNKLHLLWVETTGQIGLWKVSASGTVERAVYYGPY